MPPDDHDEGKAIIGSMFLLVFVMCVGAALIA